MGCKSSEVLRSLVARYYAEFLGNILVLVYLPGWFDIVVNDEDGNILTYIWRSFGYTVLWVLPYWWWTVLTGALVVAFIWKGFNNPYSIGPKEAELLNEHIDLYFDFDKNIYQVDCFQI